MSWQEQIVNAIHRDTTHISHALLTPSQPVQKQWRLIMEKFAQQYPDYAELIVPDRMTKDELVRYMAGCRISIGFYVVLPHQARDMRVCVWYHPKNSAFSLFQDNIAPFSVEDIADEFLHQSHVLDVEINLDEEAFVA